MVYSFARIGAALGMAVEAVFTQNRRLWVRLREKGGKRHAMPCHHNLEEYLIAYLDGAGLRDDPKGPLFRTIGRGTRPVLPQANAYAMIRWLAAAADHRHQTWQPQLPGDRDYRLSQERQHTGKSRGPWQTTPHRARRSSTIAGAPKSCARRRDGTFGPPSRLLSHLATRARASNPLAAQYQ